MWFRSDAFVIRIGPLVKLLYIAMYDRRKHMTTKRNFTYAATSGRQQL